jgi:ADP-ribose pyrophosphatase YjhB (NUDIX family)
MVKEFEILFDKTREAVIKSLMHGEKSFSELLRESKLQDHGQFNYHFKILLDNGIIIRKKDVYILTSKGEELGTYLKQIKMEEIHPLCVVCAIIKNKIGEILVLKRAKYPEKDKWNFPGGCLMVGETIEGCAEREVLEETKLNLKSKRIMGFLPSIIYKEGKVSLHIVVIPVLMESIKNQEVKINEEHTSCKFVSKKDLLKYNLIGNNKDILEVLDKKKFFFQEKKYGL